eukprot:scaffold7405_cov204-Amphora_coffeaeformis.AAC.16
MVVESYATAAPRVEEATVDRASRVEAATATAAAASEAAVAEPCKAVGAATLLYQGTPSPVKVDPKALPTKLVRGTGTAGSDLETYAAVIRGRANKNFLQILLPCLYDERDFVAYGEVKYYVLVKEGLCYVYISETDPSPLYAIALEEYTAVLEDPRHPAKGSYTISPQPNTNMPRDTMKTVLLHDRSTDRQAFQFTFDTEQRADLDKMFLELVQNPHKNKKTSRKK